MFVLAAATNAKTIVYALGHNSFKGVSIRQHGLVGALVYGVVHVYGPF